MKRKGATTGGGKVGKDIRKCEKIVTVSISVHASKGYKENHYFVSKVENLMNTNSEKKRTP